MSKVKLDKDKIFKKFKSLSMTTICIQRTSKYMYQFFKSSDEIVFIWHKAVSTGNDQLKLSLFYVANEMLQSRSYGSNYFKQSWKSQLLNSIELIKNSPIIDKIIRIFNIWIDRQVFDQVFIEELIQKLSSPRSPVLNENAKIIILNFEPEEVIEKMKILIKIEKDVNELMGNIEVDLLNFDENSCKVTIKNLKDKVNCNEFGKQLDGTINQLFRICSLMEEELKVRKSTLKIMEDAEIYYQTQLSETLVIEDAYKRYGNLISKTKDTLEEHLDFLIDDTGPIDADDAPSPGKTPPYLYNNSDQLHSSQSNKSPLTPVLDVTSPTQSMDMSDEDAPFESSVHHHDRPYSPSIAVESQVGDKNTSNVLSNVMSTKVEDSNSTFSSTDALKILTSVFTQSLTKKDSNESESRIHLQPDIFRNTLSGSIIESGDNSNDEIKNNDVNKSENNSRSLVADAFRLISNLTGIKNIGDKNNKTTTVINTTEITTMTTTSVTSTSLAAALTTKSVTITSVPGINIPILTSKNSFKTAQPMEQEKLKINLFPYNPSSYSPIAVVSTKCDTNKSPMIFPDVPNSTFQPPMFNTPINNNPIYPLLAVANHSAITAQPPPSMFNSMLSSSTNSNHQLFNLNILNKDSIHPIVRSSPGSCTEDEDEAGATPTQDEQIVHQNPLNVFPQNALPILHSNAEAVNKQIQNAMNVNNVNNTFGMSNFLKTTNEPTPSASITQQSQHPWSLANQLSFNVKSPNIQTIPSMNVVRLNLNNPINPIQPQPNFNSVDNSRAGLNFGPARAIRTKRPAPVANAESSINQNIVSGKIDLNVCQPSSQSLSSSLLGSKSDEVVDSTMTESSHDETESQKANHQLENVSKSNDKDSELYNLYGDVEEEFVKNANFNNGQQNINVRSSRIAPPSDRYHIYNHHSHHYHHQSTSMNYRFTNSDSHKNAYRINNSNNILQYPPIYNYRNQFSRGGGGGGNETYFPNRTSFRPRQNFNKMLN